MKDLTRQERISQCVTSLTGKPDFPSFSQHVQAILAKVDEEDVSARELTRLIIRDYSLSLVLLRRANAYNFSGRQILSVTHAVAMLGTEAVRHLAAGLLIFEHFHNKPAAVRELITLSMLTAGHVQQIARRVPDVQPEEAYLCGMIRNLGEVLAAYYLPQEYARILKVADERKRQLSAASEEVLQFSFEDLGEAVARYWGMPERAVECQHAAAPTRGTRHSSDLLLAAVSMGHQMTTAAYRMEPEAGAACLQLCLEDHCGILPLAREEMDAILDKSIRETQSSLAAMGVHVNELRLQAQTRAVLESMSGGVPAAVVEPADAAGVPAGVQDRDEGTLALLTEEICSLLNSGSHLDLNTLILMVLEAVYRGARFERVLFAFVNQSGSQIEGRLGLGEGVDGLMDRFKYRMSPGGGPVPAALLARRTLVGDAAQPEIRDIGRLLGCAYLGLLPIVVDGRVVGCIYMETREPRRDLQTGELRLLRQLRDSLAAAMRRARCGPEAA